MQTITNPETAYKAGFSSAMDTGAVTVFVDMRKWNFDDLETYQRKLKASFAKGYYEACGLMREVLNDCSQLK